jgi:uroporphyrin-III C-methyltransferase / precorrin-2 dehydrogenase / sirohydrochlorin ferrochelatase
MDHLPIFLRVEDREAVVVGGGAVASRKAELLLRCGARVALVAPVLGRTAAELLASRLGRLEHLPEEFRPAHLDCAVLVIAATDCRETNALVCEAARERRIPVNVADDPELSTFILPAIVDRSPVIVAVGSQGAAPVLARRLRAQLEALLPARLGALARFAGARRQSVQRALPPSERRPFWERILGGRIGAQVLAGEETGAAAAFEGELHASRSRGPRLGEVYLIGAGPGDPDLLTLRALQCLQEADVILYDRLVSAGVLDRARREAERVFVGKGSPRGASSHTAGAALTPQRIEHADAAAQERINALLLEYARRGLRVARLKGGDPFVFGRGGEEIASLVRHGIPFTVIPGITAGLAAAAGAAIPLTQREISQSVTFATGQFAADDSLDWLALARPRQTVVFYMAVAQLERIVARLREAGAPPDRPAALIERASLPEQRVLRTRLADLPGLARARNVAAPALLIIGEVAAGAQAEAIESLSATLRGVA